MEKIALITDSSCDLSDEDLKKYNINMLPMRIIYKDREYLDRIEMTYKELYDSLEDEIPTTSLPDAKYAENLFNRIKDEGFTHAIIINISSKLSGTFNSIRLLTEEFEGLEFYQFDTKTLGYPVGAISVEAARLIKQGLNFEEVKSKLEDIRTRVHGFVTFKTLEYLKRGGRIGKVAGTIAELLHVKPIISSDEEGVLYTFQKARGRKQAIAKLKEVTNSYLEKTKCRIWVLSAQADEEAKAFYESIKTNANISKITIENIGASMGIHTGPGSLGICILEEV